MPSLEQKKPVLDQSLCVLGVGELGGRHWAHLGGLVVTPASLRAEGGVSGHTRAVHAVGWPWVLSASASFLLHLRVPPSTAQEAGGRLTWVGGFARHPPHPIITAGVHWPGFPWGLRS